MNDRPKRPAVSLKWFLIGSTVLGAGGGSLYRLLTTDPNTFQGVIALVCGPVAALVLLATAIRSAWKRAPERDYRALRWIAVAAAMPILGCLAWWVSFPNGRLYASISTASLIANHVRIGSHQGWSELNYRLSSGQLTGEHVDTLLDIIAAGFDQQRQTKGMLHLPWGRDLLGDPEIAELASDEALSNLAAAVYHPKIDFRRRFQEKGVFDVAVRAPGLGPFITLPVEACWEVVGFTAGGDPVPHEALLTRQSTRPSGEVFSLDRESEVVRVEVRVAAFRGSQKLDGFASLPKSSRATDPDEEALKTWTVESETRAREGR